MNKHAIVNQDDERSNLYNLVDRKLYKRRFNIFLDLNYEDEARQPPEFKHIIKGRKRN